MTESRISGNRWRCATLVLIVSSVLAACGGGGGGGTGPVTRQPPPALVSMLLFDGNLPFNSNDDLVTEGSRIGISGGLEDQFLPVSACPDDGIIPQTLTLRWTNEANNASGTVDIRVFCFYRSFFGLIASGVDSEFIIDVPLEFGNNRIRLETRDEGVDVGLDFIVAIRKDVFPPQITSHYPDTDSTDIPINRSIAVEFNEPMAVASLTSERFAVTDESALPVAGQLSYDDASFMWQFQPEADLQALAQYTVTISGDVEDENGGNALGTDETWSFTTGTEADVSGVSVTQVWPDTSCDCAPVTTRILARLSEPLDLEASANPLMEMRAAGGALVQGSVHYRDLDYLELVPETSLVGGSTYTVTVKAGLRDLDGHLLDSDFSWQFVTDARSPGGLWTPMEHDDQMPALIDARAVWTGTQAIVYGWELGDVGDFGLVGEGRNAGGIYDPATDTWQTSLDASGQPTSRLSFTATWNGSSMIVWGGRFGDAIRGDGALYDPESDSWAPLAPPADLNVAGTYSHAALWTGTELIVWGGMAANQEATNKGFAYAPGTDQWRELSTVGAPSPRYAATAVWTGTEAIIWGGSADDGQALANGAGYDPIADMWTPIPAAAAAFGPDSSSAVWTGSELLIWNGGKTEAGQTLNDRFRETTLRLYDPVTESWRTSASGWEPFYRIGYRAYWTGSQLLTFASNVFDGAYSYDFLTDAWQPLANDPVMIRSGPVSLWADGRVVVWSGTLSIFPIADGTVFRP